MPFLRLPLETDPDAVTARILDDLAIRFPGWSAHESGLDVALAEEIGRETAATNARTVDAAEIAVAGFGESIHGLAPITGEPATLRVAFELTNTATTIPAGFRVIATTTDDVEVAFTVRNTLTPASTNVMATLVAADVGAAANGVPVGELQVATATANVLRVRATAPSTGGVDPETLPRYLDRLVDYIAILRPGGVRASDLAILARATTGVARALAVDLYDAQTGSTTAERTVTVFPVDALGQPVTAAVSQALRAALEAVREVNFVFRIASPTYTPVDIDVTVVAEREADPVAVEAAVRSAALAYLSPARWGATNEDVDDWAPQPVVRYLELARITGGAAGVAYAQNLTINDAPTDAMLAGVAAMPAPAVATPFAPTPSTVTVTVL